MFPEVWVGLEVRRRTITVKAAKLQLKSAAHSEFLTFHQDLGHGLDDPQAAHGHARVVGRFSHAVELQHVAPDGHFVLGGEVLGAQHPLDVRHGRAHRHTGDVDAPSRHDLVVRGEDGKTRGHAAHWERRRAGADRGRGVWGEGG